MTLQDSGALRVDGSYREAATWGDSSRLEDECSFCGDLRRPVHLFVRNFSSHGGQELSGIFQGMKEM
jgi:hypothetical protein